MRKLTIVLATIGIMFTASAARAQGYGMAGCGLGSILFGNDNSKLMQMLALTTNGIAGNIFAITSGTSNCTSGGVVKAQREQTAFAEVNFQDLKRNMATGGGEFLTSFSTLLGCEEAAKPTFFRMTQEKYESILPSEKSGPLDLVVAVKAQIKSDARLAHACTDERAIARAEGRSTTKLALAKPASDQAAR
jgi:hypothetical protein